MRPAGCRILLISPDEAERAIWPALICTHCMSKHRPARSGSYEAETSEIWTQATYEPRFWEADFGTSANLTFCQSLNKGARHSYAVSCSKVSRILVSSVMSRMRFWPGRPPCRFTLCVWWEYSHCGEELGRMSQARHALYMRVAAKLNELGVRYTLPPYQVRACGASASCLTARGRKTLHQARGAEDVPRLCSAVSPEVRDFRVDTAADARFLVGPGIPLRASLGTLLPASAFVSDSNPQSRKPAYFPNGSCTKHPACCRHCRAAQMRPTSCTWLAGCPLLQRSTNV